MSGECGYGWAAIGCLSKASSNSTYPEFFGLETNRSVLVFKLSTTKNRFSMKNGTCSKCGLQNVYSSGEVIGKHGTHTAPHIPLGGTWGGAIALEHYICVDCGYVESYVSNHIALRQITERWTRVEQLAPVHAASHSS